MVELDPCCCGRAARKSGDPDKEARGNLDHAPSSPPVPGTGNLMKHGETPAANDTLGGLFERSAASLCALAFLISGDWNLGIDAVATALVAGLENNPLSKGVRS